MPLGTEKVLQLAKGFRGRSKNCITVATRSVEKALQHAYRGRKQKKRDWRSLWITRIGAASKEHGVSYSRLIFGLGQENIGLNRKMLSDIAINEPYSFKALVDQVKFMRGAP
eukprot:gene6720-3391_t